MMKDENVLGYIMFNYKIRNIHSGPATKFLNSKITESLSTKVNLLD